MARGSKQRIPMTWPCQARFRTGKQLEVALQVLHVCVHVYMEWVLRRIFVGSLHLAYLQDVFLMMHRPSLWDSGLEKTKYASPMTILPKAEIGFPPVIRLPHSFCSTVLVPTHMQHITLSFTHAHSCMCHEMLPLTCTRIGTDHAALPTHRQACMC